jgi:hypothetical protein
MPFLHASTWMYVLGQCMEQLPRAKNGRTSCTYTLLAIPGTALYRTSCTYTLLAIPGTALYRTSCT